MKSRHVKELKRNRPAGALITDDKTSRRMSRMPKTATSPEQAVAGLLDRNRIEYARDNKDLPGNPDFADRRRRWAIFVNGCFWHHHAGCPRATVPKRNTQFWLDKFKANRERDERAVVALKEGGFDVHVLWECEIASAEHHLALRWLICDSADD